MSSQIPPLVCHTPPPIDFDDADDDADDYGPEDIPEDDGIGVDEHSGADCLDDDFGDFATVPSRLTPEPIPGASVIEKDTKEIARIPVLAETKSIFVPRVGNDSPPSLILPTNNFIEDDEVVSGTVDEEDYDFQPFGCPSQPPEPPPEDSVSLPSLHLDADTSKSEDDDPIPTLPNPSSATGSGIETEVDFPAVAVPTTAERTTPVIYEGGRFDDNTENDFTDFTTASNERSSVVLEIPTANDVSFELDDYAQLESTPSADSNFVSQQSRTDFATFDADFSKFDSFQASFPATVDDPVVVKTPLDEMKSMPNVEQQASAKNQPEQLPEDDFDDFQEFATFSEQPVASVSSVQPTTSFKSELATNACSVAEIDSTQNATDSAKLAGDNAGNDDDDDFGEFSDFKQPEVTQPSIDPVPSFSLENVQNLLETMFPNITPEPHASDTGQQSTEVHIPNNSLHSTLQDFDNTSALSYQYSKSTSSKTLVTALGIDSRNIMYGPKWNSSMPRFAANLSFNPLEPLKPGTTASKDTGSTANEKHANFSTAAKVATMTAGLDPLQPTGAPSSSVPAVQFDWNSSGLVNPLEGVQEMLQKATAGQPPDGAKGEILDPEIPEDAGTLTADDIAVMVAVPAAAKVSLTAHLEDDDDVRSLDFTANATANGSSNVQYSATLPPHANQEPTPQPPVGPMQPQPQYSTPPQQQPMSISTSPNNVPVVRTIKLQETHIFTPSRGGTPVSRDITDRDIIVREYHDVEYSLEKPPAPAGGSRPEPDFDEFNDFQSVPVIAPSVTPGAAATYARPVIGQSPTEELEKRGTAASEAKRNGMEEATARVPDGTEDDDFTEFQAATVPMPAVPQPVNKAVSNVQHNRSNTSSPVMLLSPAILLPQQASTPAGKDSHQAMSQIDWPEPGIDPDELARFEAAFAKPAPQKVVSPTAAVTTAAPKEDGNQSAAKPTTVSSAVDEDEWTDFISSKPVVSNDPPAASNQQRGPVAAAPMGVAVQEEWTDFISNTPSTAGFTSQNRLSSSQNNFNYSRPSAGSSGAKAFNSWSQPQLPPPQFSSWNSNSLYYNPMSTVSATGQQQQQYGASQHQQQFYGRPENAPAFSGNHSSSFNVAGPSRVPTHPQHHHHHLHNAYQHHQAAGGARVLAQQPMHLLPELSFITPNAGAHSSAAHGAKPATHSFLSNVISSNSFTKK
uniref:Aftiphilin clathrin-binding box domain-containing protein n=1 Tax=Anopheles atroparvus TaxID=41427 RepID=A0AAG5CSF3_ANOAO